MKTWVAYCIRGLMKSPDGCGLSANQLAIYLFEMLKKGLFMTAFTND